MSDEYGDKEEITGHTHVGHATCNASEGASIRIMYRYIEIREMGMTALIKQNIVRLDVPDESTMSAQCLFI